MAWAIGNIAKHVTGAFAACPAQMAKLLRLFLQSAHIQKIIGRNAFCAGAVRNIFESLDAIDVRCITRAFLGDDFHLATNKFRHTVFFYLAN